MDRNTYRAEHSKARAFIRFAEEASAVGGVLAEGTGPAGDIVVRSLFAWFGSEYLPTAERIRQTVAHRPLSNALNWRESYLLHNRDRAVLAHYRNRRWFRAASPLRAMEAV